MSKRLSWGLFTLPGEKFNVYCDLLRCCIGKFPVELSCECDREHWTRVWWLFWLTVHQFT